MKKIRIISGLIVLIILVSIGAAQIDPDGDGIPDDTDEDGIPDYQDNCPDIYNPEQNDPDGNGIGEACEIPEDIDLILEPLVAETSDTSLSYTDPETNVTFTLETSNKGKKRLHGKADKITKKPKRIEIYLEEGDTESTTASIKGLNPNSLYHMYKDSYANHKEFITDASGSYSFTQDTSAVHYVWIQDEEAHTVFINDMPKCANSSITGINYGIWDPMTRTCTLNDDLSENVEIAVNNIVLDCNGHTISGTGTEKGIFNYQHNNVTIKNCNVQNFLHGIHLYLSSNNTILNNIFSNNRYDIRVSSSNNNIIKSNNIYNNQHHSIILDTAENNIIRDNIIDGVLSIAIHLYNGDYNTITNNSIYNSGSAIHIWVSNNNITNNSLQSNTQGVYIAGNNNIVTGNNFSQHYSGMYIRGSNNIMTGNEFSQNRFGIRLTRPYYGVIEGNLISNNNIHNNDYGVTFEEGPHTNNIIYNNYFNNILNAVDNGTNSWNIDKTEGKNIIGDPYLGGNFWSDYNGHDTDSGGLGDTKLPYNSGGKIENGGDYLPLTTRVGVDSDEDKVIDPDDNCPNVPNPAQVDSEFKHLCYVVNENNGDYKVISFEDNNIITAGTTVLNLNRGEIGTFNVPLGTAVKGTGVFYADTTLNGGAPCVPAVFAGTEFVYRSQRQTNEFSLYAYALNDANIQIYENGILKKSEFVVGGTVKVIEQDIANRQTVRITSDSPILVSHSTYENSDGYNFYPAGTDWYGVPSKNLHIGAGPGGAYVEIYKSDGTVKNVLIGADGSYVMGRFGSDGGSYAAHVVSNKPIGVHQLGDGDGIDASTFLPAKELNTEYFIPQDAQYIAIAAPTPSTTCTVYEPDESPKETKTSGNLNDPYPNFILFGGDYLYVNAGARLECNNPVFAYYEQDANNQETNLFGASQMKTGDGFGALCDNCENAYNLDQLDLDGDTKGDICDDCPADLTDSCVLTESASNNIDESGGTVETSSGNANVDIPTNALTTDTSISITGGTDTPKTDAFQLQTGKEGISLIYTFGPEGIIFNEPVTINLKYNDTGIDEDTIDVYYYNSTSELWEPLGAECNTDTNTCSLNVTHFSDYIIGAVAVDTDGDGIPDLYDSAPLDPYICQDSDLDTCDDCIFGTYDPTNDGTDTDSDGICDAGDICLLDPDNDIDEDGICGDVDNCPDVSNAGQENSDSDEFGDACDICPLDPENDADGDGVCGDVDICPLDPENDADGDGVCGDVDSCKTTPGKPEYQGCPVGDENLVELHVIDKAKTFCNGAGSCKLPIENAEIKVFDRNNADFQALFTKNPKGTDYPTIFKNASGMVGSCMTNAEGKCTVGEGVVGDYLVIAKYEDTETGKVIHTGKPKSPEDFEDTDNDGMADLAYKDFQIIKVINQNSIDFKAGSKTVVTGSFLEVIHPQYVIWENNLTLYPFIFRSDSDWEVDVCVYVPEGYAVVEGDCTQVFLANETRDVIFTVVEIGSPEPDVEIDLNTKHKGKVQKVKLDIPGKRTKKYMESKGKGKS